MVVKCIKDEGYLFSIKTVRQGNLTKTNYQGIQIGEMYTVYGIVLYEDGIYYLIFDGFKMASWYSAELFEVTDQRVPSSWLFNFFGHKEYGVSAIWGYEELVLSEVHYNRLCEQESSEYVIFYKRKREIDNEFK